MMNALLVSRISLWCLALSPLVYLALLVITDALGPDPAKKLALLTGEWTLCYLLFTLSLSTLARYYPPARVLLRCRRMAGLWTFFYACLHVLVFVVLYLGLDAAVLLRELQKRPYITVGFLAWLLLLPMAITSNNYAVRRLGKNWKTLHQLVYLALLLALCHVIWQVRSDWSNAFFFSLAGLLLLVERINARR